MKVKEVKKFRAFNPKISHWEKVEALLKDKLKEDLKLYGKAFTIDALRPTLVRLGYCLNCYYQCGRVKDIERLLIEVQRMLYNGLSDRHIIVHEFNIFAALMKAMTRKRCKEVKNGVMEELASRGLRRTRGSAQSARVEG